MLLAILAYLVQALCYHRLVYLVLLRQVLQSPVRIFLPLALALMCLAIFLVLRFLAHMFQVTSLPLFLALIYLVPVFLPRV